MTLLLLAAGWFVGAGLVAFAAGPWWAGAAVALAAAPAAARGHGPRGLLLATCVAGAAAAGGARTAAWHDAPPPDLLAFREARIILEGVVDSDPTHGLTTARYVVSATRLLAPEDRPIRGKVLLVASEFLRLPLGERVRLSGVLRTPRSSPEFDYAAYLLQRGIVGELVRPRLERLGGGAAPLWRRIAAAARQRTEAALARTLPEPEASLAAGILVGQDSGMSPELRERFRRSGLAHLVAVSGSNVAIVTGAAFLVAVPLVGRRAAVLPAALLAVGYSALVGGDPPSVRATIMAAVFLAGLVIGRPQAGLPALGLAAVAMTAAEPRLLTDVGFQLSCAATAALIAWFPWADALLDRAVAAGRLDPFVPRPLRVVTALTLCATVATTPIAWQAFGTVSLVGPLANAIAQPLFVPAFVLAGATAAAETLWHPAGWAAGLVAFEPLRAIIWAAETLGTPTWAALEAPPLEELPLLAGVTALLAVGWAAVRRRPPPRSPRRTPSALLRRARWGALGALTGGALALVAMPFAQRLGGPGFLQLAVLDVGQGDALLVTTPNGYDLLVDCGPSGVELVRELGAVMPHWDRKVDRLLISHPQADHVGGCAAFLDRYEVADPIAWSGAHADNEAWRALLEREAPGLLFTSAQEWRVDGVAFRVWWPPPDAPPSTKVNDRSVVLEVRYGKTRLLLTGDIERGPEAALAEVVGDVDVLKVPHHGSATNRGAFFAALAPEIAVISVGRENPYGHPAATTLRDLGRVGATVYRTDVHGRVVIRSDGERLRVETSR